MKTFTVVLTEDEVTSILHSMVVASGECQSGGCEAGILLAFENAGVDSRALSEAKREFKYELERARRSHIPNRPADG